MDRMKSKERRGTAGWKAGSVLREIVVARFSSSHMEGPYVLRHQTQM